MPTTSVRTASVDEPLLTARDVARLLNYGTVKPIRRMVRQGGLPAFMVRNRLRFRRADIERWLEASSTLAAS